MTLHGAMPIEGGRTRFGVWAPGREVTLQLLSPERRLPMTSEDAGFHRAEVTDAPRGTRYRYLLDDGRAYADPASRWQPDGVLGPSAVADPAFPWTDGGWTGLPLDRLVFYELHVGAFTREGTFDAVIPRLPVLQELGITAIELMPVSQFPGGRNWGYDGVFPFAAHDTYGGPDGLRRLVDACHRAGLAVFLDVVYNHLGPEGNVLGAFGPFFTARYKTPWGDALNFDGAGSDEVRSFFVESARWWVEGCHVDGLRLDAVHAIVDLSPYPFLEELADAARGWEKRQGRRIHLIAENGRNDPRLAERPERGGIGLDALWNDDFHHALHALLTGGRDSYYGDFGRLDQMEKGFREGFVFSGERSPFFGRRHGRTSRNLPAERLVVFAQNHDQVGNRMLGERMTALASFEGCKMAAGLVLLSPFIPLLFMGEEYGETAPFQYFISHLDPKLVEAVRKGRAEEFRAFRWSGEAPDPQDPVTFERCRLDFDARLGGRHAALWGFHKELIALRKTLPAFASMSKETRDVGSREEDRILWVRRRSGGQEALLLFHFGCDVVSATLPLPAGTWTRRLDSAGISWGGPGPLLPPRLEGRAGKDLPLRMPGESFALYIRNTG